MNRLKLARSILELGTDGRLAFLVVTDLERKRRSVGRCPIQPMPQIISSITFEGRGHKMRLDKKKGVTYEDRQGEDNDW